MNVVVTIALIWLMLVALALAFALAAQGAGRKLARRRGESAALAVLAIAATLCAQKAVTTRWTFDSYVQDAGCWASNSTVHVELAQRVPGIDLAGSPVLLYAREIGVDDPEAWTELLPRRTFAELPADYALANATNHDFTVFVDYVPPPTVHTNGVWQMRGIELPYGTATSSAFAFPNTSPHVPWSNPYITDGLVAQWDAEWNASGGVHDQNAATWKDLSGQAYDFDVPSTLSWSGDALVFPPNGDKNANRLYTNHSFTQNKTIEVVAKFNTNTSSILRANTSGNTLVFHWGFSLFWNGTNRGSGNLSVGQRHYAALCIDDADGYRIYRDRAAVAQGRAVLSPVGETAFTVGYYSATTYAFNGEICAIRFYSRPLTPEEILHNYNIDRRRFNLP